MECVYPPVRQNSQLVFLPGRNHVELRRIGWSSCSFQSGRQQVRFIAMELYSRIWICQCYQCWIDEALCFHARSLIRREPRKKWEVKPRMLSPGRTLELLECTRAFISVGHVHRSCWSSWKDKSSLLALTSAALYQQSGNPKVQLHQITPWHHGIGSSWLEASGFHSVRWNAPRSAHFKVLPKLPKMTWLETHLQHEMLHTKWMQMN